MTSIVLGHVLGYKKKTRPAGSASHWHITEVSRAHSQKATPLDSRANRQFMVWTRVTCPDKSRTKVAYNGQQWPDPRWTTVVDIGEPRFKPNDHGQQGTIVVDRGRLWSTVVEWWLNMGHTGNPRAQNRAPIAVGRFLDVQERTSQ